MVKNNFDARRFTKNARSLCFLFYLNINKKKCKKTKLLLIVTSYLMLFI